MGYILVLMNFFMQGVLLYLIFQEVVVSNIEWQNGILKLGGSSNVMGLFSEKSEACNDGGALCFTERGNYTCAPPSVQLVGRWSELDTDGDGVWTRDEVKASREALKCKYVVDPVEVFDVLANMIVLREKLIWVHPDVKRAEKIHLPYFNYAMGDLLMCGYRSKEMCPNLVERGFFDAPMKLGTAPRVGTTIDSALHYCINLLMPGGVCEQLLPSTYSVWKTESAVECGEGSYSKFTYTNPGTGVQKSLLSVDYSAREEYQLAQDWWFITFKSIIIFTWLLLMVCEFRDIIKILTFCHWAPDATEFGEDAVIREQDPSDPEDVRYRIQAITGDHRAKMIALSVLRFLITCVLTVVGVSYLIKTNAYTDLLMNGVALAFIAEISAVLYSQVLREEVKDQTEDIKPIKVPMYGIDWLNRRPALIDILTVLLIIIAVCFIMDYQMKQIVVPVYDALQCTCLTQGPNCVEAQKHDFNFWYHYWGEVVPNVFKQVDTLKALEPVAAPIAGATSYLAVSAAQAPAAVATLNERLLEIESSNAELKKIVKGLLENKESDQEERGVAPRAQGARPTGRETRREQRRHAPLALKTGSRP